MTGFGSAKRPRAPTGNPVADQFSWNLWKARKRAGISQEDLGYRAGLHRTEISLLEVAGRTPKIDTVVKLAGGLDIEPGELLEGMRWNASIVNTGNFNIKDKEER